MRPQHIKRQQRFETFAGFMRHVGRNPVLIGWGAVLIALDTVAQHNVPHPWSGMISAALLPCWIVPASVSYERSRADAEGADH
jgi:hypothetical protein